MKQWRPPSSEAPAINEQKLPVRNLSEIYPTVPGKKIPEWLAGRVLPNGAEINPAPEPTSAKKEAAPTPPPPPTPVVNPLEDPLVKAAIQRARQEGETVARKNAQAEIDTIRNMYAQGVQALELAVADARRPMPSEVVDLALVIARELVMREISVDKSLLIDLVDAALSSIDTKAGAVLRMGIDDVAYVRTKRPDLAARGIEIREDPNLGIGSCVVETACQVSEATIDARLLNLRDQLVLLLHQETQEAEESA